MFYVYKLKTFNVNSYFILSLTKTCSNALAAGVHKVHETFLLYIYKLHLHVQKCFVIGLYYNQYSNLFKGIQIYELFFHKGLKYTNTLYWH